ncbi:hypothetical protein FRC03_007667 [Tulasnella sp. 419]|nr:hypothetical protein FRC02_007387 [Tulasnella sp. 418]KAG8938065.1 hypothetical protein FRC03_007667 [Tulasnella sp. 419]
MLGNSFFRLQLALIITLVAVASAAPSNLGPRAIMFQCPQVNRKGDQLKSASSPLFSKGLRRTFTCMYEGSSVDQQQPSKSSCMYWALNGGKIYGDSDKCPDIN